MWNPIATLRAALVFVPLLVPAAVRAADLEGVHLPDALEVNGAQLTLNGIGLRTFSVLKIAVYVGALYLEHTSHDAAEILNSPEVKVILVQFVRDASAARVREAWREGFDTDCVAPCHLPPAEVARFLASVPDMHKGDISTIVFTRDEVSVTLNGNLLGHVTDPTFRRVVLATFIGPHPPTERLKREFLGGPHE